MSVKLLSTSNLEACRREEENRRKAREFLREHPEFLDEEPVLLLLEEAKNAKSRDYAQEEICRQALSGDVAAMAACGRVILNARAQRDSE